MRGRNPRAGEYSRTSRIKVIMHYPSGSRERSLDGKYERFNGYEKLTLSDCRCGFEIKMKEIVVIDAGGSESMAPEVPGSLFFGIDDNSAGHLMRWSICKTYRWLD
jgi:hypothetical protein